MLELQVLTGFLGSGKTTLLRDYLSREDAAGTAVIVNEAGEIGLDGAILAEGRNGLRMAMLANGCICCAAGGELALTIEDLLASAPVAPSRIVLETSGLSKPGAILRGLQARPTVPMRIGVVATFDCVRHGDVATFEEAAAQWAGAQVLVLTRLDQAGDAGAAEGAARAVNPLARIVVERDRGAALQEAFAPGPAAPLRVPEVETPHPRIIAFTARQTGAIAWDDLAAWLDAISFRLGERLLRVKGAIRLEGRAVLIQSVGTLFSAPRPIALPDGPGFLTLIARDTAAAEFGAADIALSVTAPSPFARRGAALSSSAA